MFINYKLVDGSYILVEVTEEVAALLAEDDRRTANADRKERYHTPYSIDALDFEGMEFAYHETPETIYIRKEENEHMKEVLARLTDTQLRRLQMRADGMTLREIAASEETSVNAVKCSLDAVRKIFQKYS